MANISVFNIEGKEVGSIELNDAVFGVNVNEHLVHMAVVAQLANKRQGTQKAKTRSEVSGGGRKPWKHKGTGHKYGLSEVFKEIFKNAENPGALAGGGENILSFYKFTCSILPLGI